MRSLRPSDDTYRRILGLRAIRVFREEPLSDADLEAILEAGRWTGSSKNRQQWAFVVVDEPEGLERLATAGDFTEPLLGAAAAVAIVRLPGGYDFDLGRAAQNMMLAAAARGVASCPITLHHTERAHDILGIPPEHHCRFAVALGYPDTDRIPDALRAARERGLSGRRPLRELAHRGTFGTPWQ